MSNVTEFGKKVKGQEKKLMENVSWVVGIYIGKEKLSCALMNMNKALICRFDGEGTLAGYNELLTRVKKETKGSGKIVFALEPTGHHWKSKASMNHRILLTPCPLTPFPKSRSNMPHIHSNLCLL